jgi:hypothetical protein
MVAGTRARLVSSSPSASYLVAPGQDGRLCIIGIYGDGSTGGTCAVLSAATGFTMIPLRHFRRDGRVDFAAIVPDRVTAVSFASGVRLEAHDDFVSGTASSGNAIVEAADPASGAPTTTTVELGGS